MKRTFPTLGAVGVRGYFSRWDLIAVPLILGALLLALAFQGSREPFAPGTPDLTVSLDPRFLSYYGLRSFVRMLLAAFFSLIFTVRYATLAAKSRRAEKVMILVHVRLAQQPESTNQRTLHDLGISQSALSGLIKADREPCSLAFPGQGVARLTPDQETIERFKRELEILRQEREILKPAAVFVGRTAPMRTLARFLGRTAPMRTLARFLGRTAPMRALARFLGRTTPVWGLPADLPRKQSDIPVRVCPAAPVSPAAAVLEQNGRPSWSEQRGLFPRAARLGTLGRCPRLTA